MGPLASLNEIVSCLRLLRRLRLPRKSLPAMLAFDASAFAQAPGKPPPGPPDVGSKPPGPPSTTYAPVPGSTWRRAADSSTGASVPMLSQSCLPALLAGTSIFNDPRPEGLMESSTLSRVGFGLAKSAMLVASLPSTVIRRETIGLVFCGLILRQTEP